MSSFACLSVEDSSDSESFDNDSNNVISDDVMIGKTSEPLRMIGKTSEPLRMIGKTSEPLRMITAAYHPGEFGRTFDCTNYVRDDDGAGWLDVKTVKKSGTASTVPVSIRRATDLQKTLNVDKLRGTLMSQESLNLQADGWIYDRVIKNTGPAAFDFSKKEGMEYTHITIPNNWSDQIIFRRIRIGDISNPSSDDN